jgi:hypothetical protein
MGWAVGTGTPPTQEGVISIVVWKHDLGDSVAIDLKLHHGARVLHFAEQHGRACLWEMHDADETEVERRRFRILGTGHPDPNLMPARFIATALFHGGDYVFHLFELDAPPNG